MLAALGTLATQQANRTQATMEALTQLLHYCATHPHAVIQTLPVRWSFGCTAMLLICLPPKALMGYWLLLLEYIPQTWPTAMDEPPPDNEPVHVPCQIMKQEVSSTAKAKLGALFLNAQAVCPIQTALDELGHLQPATPLQTDNSMASGIANDMVKQKQSKAINMHFY